MEDTPSFRGVPIRYFRDQDGVLQICLKDVCEALGLERYDTVAIPIKKYFGVASLGVGAFAEEDGNDSFTSWFSAATQREHGSSGAGWKQSFSLM